MTTKPKIVFTGGGSAGHVTANIALIERFLQARWSIFYIGSQTGMERQLITKLGIKYYPIATGKLRRYFSWKTPVDCCRIIICIVQAWFICRQLKPQILFSKGGFVAFPAVIGAWLNRIPIVSHESDVTPGLANKLIFPFATKLCVNFDATKIYFKNSNKIVVSGTPLRQKLYGDAKLGYEFCGFTPKKKTLLVIGGSFGAEKINVIVSELLPDILADFQVAHICGAGKIDANCNYPGYKQFAYLDDVLGDVLACVDLVISRAGANALYELLVLHKPNILIPLGTSVSRGDQIANAEYAVAHGFSQLLMEENLTAKILRHKINWVMANYSAITANLARFKPRDSIQIIFELLASLVANRDN